MSLSRTYVFGTGTGVKRLHNPAGTPSNFSASGIGAGVVGEAEFESTYDTWDRAVITHGASGRQYLVRWDRRYTCRGIRDYIVHVEERRPHKWLPGVATWTPVDLDAPALATWMDADYATPDDLIESAEDMIRLLVSGGAE